MQEKQSSFPGELHRSKPATVVQYSKKLPDTESLMQVWPDEMERYLESSFLNIGQLDNKSLSLKDYVRVGQRQPDRFILQFLRLTRDAWGTGHESLVTAGPFAHHSTSVNTSERYVVVSQSTGR